MSNKHDIGYCKNIAKSKGGECISLKYISIGSKLKWRCSKGHEWESTFNHIKNTNSWCPKCAYTEKADKRKLKDGLLIAKEIAISHDGICLSKEYINIHTGMAWRCSDGHEWVATLNKIKNRKSWCKKCANNSRILKNGLKIANIIAKEKDGRCLCKKYTNASVKVKWECSEKHTWEASIKNIRNGTWCPECGRIQAAKKTSNSYILTHWKTGEEVVCVASYEKAVVEYLNLNKINFRWQPKTFTTNILTKTGKFSTYRPDLYLFSTKKWIEVKGYFRGNSKEKWEWFQTIKPNSELWDEKKLKEMKIL